MYEPAGRTVLITGAARGIGATTAERLHELGANVALVGLEPDRLGALAESLGERALWHEADVTDPAALADAVALTVERFGAIDIAIANAGVHWTGTFDSTPLERIEREIEINLLGVVRTNHAVLPQILSRRGYILNIASLAAASHTPMMTAYSAAKAGVEAFSNSLRQEVRGDGVRVGCAYFGVIDTDMVRDAYADPAIDHAKKMMPSMVARPVPRERAVEAIVNGIRRRKSRVWAPRWVGPALWTRDLGQRLLELRAAHSRTMREVLALARAEKATGPTLRGDRGGGEGDRDEVEAPKAAR